MLKSVENGKSAGRKDSWHDAPTTSSTRDYTEALKRVEINGKDNDRDSVVLISDSDTENDNKLDENVLPGGMVSSEETLVVSARNNARRVSVASILEIENDTKSLPVSLS